MAKSLVSKQPPETWTEWWKVQRQLKCSEMQVCFFRSLGVQRTWDWSAQGSKTSKIFLSTVNCSIWLTFPSENYDGHLIPLPFVVKKAGRLFNRDAAKCKCTASQRDIQCLWWFEREWPPKRSHVQTWVPSWCNCLGRIGRCSLIASVSLEWNLRCQTSTPFQWVLLLPCAHGSDVKFSATVPVPCPTMVLGHLWQCKNPW